MPPESVPYVDSSKRCPHCAGLIPRAAKLCGICHSDLRSWFLRHKLLSAIALLFLTVTALAQQNRAKTELPTSNAQWRLVSTTPPKAAPSETSAARVLPAVLPSPTLSPRQPEPLNSTPPPVEPSSASSETVVPPNVTARIRQHIETAWPDSYTTQRMMIDAESSAYRDIETYTSTAVPPTTLSAIIAKEAREWPDSYTTQKMMIDAEVSAYTALQTYTAPQVPAPTLREILAKQARDWPDSFATQKMMVDAEVSSYVAMHPHP